MGMFNTKFTLKWGGGRIDKIQQNFKTFFRSLKKIEKPTHQSSSN
jgi:hypothetical protein